MAAPGAQLLCRGRKARSRKRRDLAQTAFTYKGTPVDARAIGRDLGVRYLFEGSVRRSGDKVAVNAQLVSTETGAHIWADRFEGERANLGQLQFDIVARLANSLGVELIGREPAGDA